MEKPVFFKNKRGKQLVGMLHLPKGKKKFPLVLFSHGFGSTKTTRKYVRLARALEKESIASLRFDFEGCGDSQGDLEKMTVQGEVSDLAAAVKYILSRKDINKDRVAFLGSSLGGAICLLFVAQNNFPAKTLVFWAPALNQKKLFPFWYSKNDLRKWKKQGYFIKKEDKLGPSYFEENKDKDYSLLLPRIKIPILIIHGEKDETVPPGFSKRLAKKYKNIKLVLLPGADHKIEDYHLQKRLIQKIEEWFKKKI